MEALDEVEVDALDEVEVVGLGEVKVEVVLLLHC